MAVVGAVHALQAGAIGTRSRRHLHQAASAQRCQYCVAAREYDFARLCGSTSNHDNAITPGAQPNTGCLDLGDDVRAGGAL